MEERIFDGLFKSMDLRLRRPEKRLVPTWCLLNYYCGNSFVERSKTVYEKFEELENE